MLLLVALLLIVGCQRRTIEQQRASSQQQIAMGELLIEITEAMLKEPATNTIRSVVKSRGPNALLVPGTAQRFHLNHRTDLWQGILSNKTSAVALFYLLGSSTNDARGLTFDGQFIDFRVDEGSLNREDFPQ